MSSRLFLHMLLVLHVLSAANCLLAADEAGPVNLDEIRQLRKEKKSHDEIIAIVKDRGLGFDINTSAQRTLRRLGFRRADIEQLKAIPKADDNQTDGQANPAVAGVPRELQEPEFQRFAERITKIRQASETDSVITRSDHITLICNKALAARVMQDVKRLEKILAKRFPAPLGAGPDSRVANIALFPTRYDYQKWVRALFDVYEAEGMNFEGENPLEMALRTERYLVKGIFTCCLEKMTPLQLRHAVAYAVGFHYLERITDEQAPMALRSGFGNVAEVLQLGNPTMMLNSGYADRNLGKGGNPWAIIVRQRFLQNKVPPVQDVLNYRTSIMEFPQYAECWSLAMFLSSRPKEFSSLVRAFRDGEPTLESIETIYGLEADELHRRWRQFASRFR